MSDGKKAKKTTVRTTAPVVKVPQPHGGALNAGGTPGNKGGRPPLEYVEWCKSLLDDPESRAAVEAVMKDRKHPAFAMMHKTFAERAHGRPKESLEVSGKDGAPIQVQVWKFGSKKVAF